MEARIEQAKRTESLPRYADDCQYARLLVCGDTEAWDRFYIQFRKKLQIYTKQKYPDVFDDIALEEICDGVGKRLIENDYKALKEFRGDCSFSTYLTKATDWEIKDWLRRYSQKLLDEPLDPANDHDESLAHNGRYSSVSESDEENNQGIPEAIKSLNDEMRWAFLLRYYDYFGFPFDEIRLLARKRNVPIKTITQELVKYLEPGGDDVLSAQREKQRAFRVRLEKTCYEIHKLTIKEHKMSSGEEVSHSGESADQLRAVRERRSTLGAKREALLMRRSKIVVTTPYEVIADILVEANVSTVRSRIFLAKKKLIEILSGK